MSKKEAIAILVDALKVTEEELAREGRCEHANYAYCTGYLKGAVHLALEELGVKEDSL